MASVEMSPVVPQADMTQLTTALSPMPPQEPRARLTPPGKMAKPALVALNSFAVCVKWVPPADLHSRRSKSALLALSRGGLELSQDVDLPVKGYKLRYLIVNDREAPPAIDEEAMVQYVELEGTWGPDCKEAILKWMEGGTDYVFEVMAYNSSGNGPWSDPSDIFRMPTRDLDQEAKKLTALALPATPQLGRWPKVFSNSPSAIEMQWEIPCHRGAEVQSFDILCSKDLEFGPDATKQFQIAGDAKRFVVEDLEPNMVYYFKYRANNMVGASDWSERTHGVATKGAPPDRLEAPTALGEQAKWKPFEVGVKWESSETYAIPIQHYRVRVSTSPDMMAAVEVPLGAAGKGSTVFGTAGDEEDEPEGEQSATAGSPKSYTTPKSQTSGRPGFNRSNYALTQLRVKGLKPSTSYYFQVQAVNQIGCSEWSAPSGPMRTQASPPGQCTPPLYLSGTKHDGFRIKWRMPDDRRVPGGIQKYDVRVAHNEEMVGAKDIPNIPAEHYEEDGGQWMEVQVPGSTDPSVDHFMQVRAHSSAGSGRWSACSEAMRVDPEAPVRPDPPHRFVALPRTIVVHWKEPDCRGSPPIGYRLRYDTSQEMVKPVEVLGLRGTALEMAVAGLFPNRSYYFQVSCVNRIGASDWSPPSRGARVLHSPPTKMGAPFLLAKGSTNISVGFTPPADCGTLDGEMLTSYTLKYASGPNRALALENPAAYPAEDDKVREVDAKPSGAEVTGLLPGQQVAFLVYATNEFGEGEPSDVAEFTTDSSVPCAPKPPEKVEATELSITLCIDKVVDNGSPVVNYGLEVYELCTGTNWETLRFDAKMSEENGRIYQTISPLKSGTEYQFRAIAENSNGLSEWSGLSEAIKTVPIPPLPVKVLSVTFENVTSHSFEVRWDIPFDNGDPVLEFSVQWSPDNTFEKNVKEKKVTEQFCLCEDCLPGNFCFVRVSAANAYGYGPYSQFKKVLMLPDVPLAPVDAKQIEAGCTHSKISWMITWDCGSPITNFLVRYTETATDGRPEEERDGGVLSIAGKRRFCFIEPLFSRREYIYEIAAENTVGVGPWSTPSQPARIAPPEVPIMPSAPVHMSSTIHTAMIKWATGVPNGTPDTEQLIRVSLSPDFPEGEYQEIVVPAWSKETACAPPEDPGKKKKGKELKDLRGSKEGAETRSTGTSISGGDSPRLSNAGGASAAALLGMSGFSEAAFNKKELVFEQLEGRRNVQALAKRAPPKGYRWGSGTVPDLQPGTFYYAMVACRNEMGMSPWGPVSAKFATAAAPPDPIPADPGIELLRTGCTTLTFGWQRPYCWGAPVTHYRVRFAETQEDLWKDDCQEWAHEEMDREEWPGIAEPVPTPPPIEVPDLENKEKISAFVEYLMVRFGSLETSWEWLDVNGNGDVSREEFIEGDVDSGPPFADFARQDILPDVWDLLHPPSIAGDSITLNEFNKLRPYMEAVRAGSAGVEYKGVYCLVPSLQPGKSYYIMARACNKAGMSDWTQCSTHPHKTEGMTPAKMGALRGIPEKRTTTSVAFAWELPYNNGAEITHLEVRWAAKHLDDGVLERSEVRFGTLVEVKVDPATGKIPSEIEFGGLRPGMQAFAVARAWNKKGGSREWSDLPGPGSGNPEERWTWDSSTLPLRPETPNKPTWLADTVKSIDAMSEASFEWSINQGNGPPHTGFSFEVVHCHGDPTTYMRHDLKIIIEGARNLRSANHGVASDPFCVCEIPGKEDARWITPHIAETLNPVWNHEGEQLDFLQSNELKLEIFDKDQGKKSDSLGHVTLTFDQLKDGIDGELQLQDAGEGQEAFLKVKIECISQLKTKIAEWDSDAAEGERHTGASGMVREVGRKMLPGETYVVRVKTRNCVGDSDWSEWSDFVRTPPDRPFPCAPLLSEFASLTWIEVKWFPPHCNGDPVTEYDIMMAPDENLPEDEWLHIDRDKMQRSTKRYGQDGRRRTAANKNALLCRVQDLPMGKPTYFKVRAANRMGWSDWSEVSCFVTKPARPGKLELTSLKCSEITSRSLTLTWEEPPNNGAKVERYDLVGGPCMLLMKWTSVVARLLGSTVDADKLWNYQLMTGIEMGEIWGSENFDKFRCEEGMYTPIEAHDDGSDRVFKLDGLLPGQNYYFIVRGVCSAGKGEFSEIIGPLRTKFEKAVTPLPMQISYVTQHTCEALLTLPFNGGSAIDDIRVTWRRVAGPLSESQIDPATGEPREDLKVKEMVQDFKLFPFFSTIGTGERYMRRIPGVTDAWCQIYKDEQLDEDMFMQNGIVPTMKSCTGKVLLVTMDDCLPGTDYEAHWQVHNSEGWSEVTEVSTWHTRATRPDTPKGLFIPGL